MKILVYVKPRSAQVGVEKIGKDQFLVRVKAPAKENKANKEVIELLSDYFKVAKSQINILKGLKSRQKIVAIGFTMLTMSNELIGFWNLLHHLKMFLTKYLFQTI